MVPVADCNLRRYLEHCTESGYKPAELNPIFHWFGCILKALNHAHHLSIEHRDIKPSNILIKDKTPYLADFGLAKDFSKQEYSFSETSLVEGTPQYFAPEYQPGERYGRIADVFALGCVFSEMLTVANYKSLAEYKNWRRRPQATHESFAFRDSLPKVREWLWRIEKSQLNDILVHQTLEMLHQDPEQRPQHKMSYTSFTDNAHYFARFAIDKRVYLEWLIVWDPRKLEQRAETRATKYSSQVGGYLRHLLFHGLFLSCICRKHRAVQLI